MDECESLMLLPVKPRLSFCLYYGLMKGTSCVVVDVDCCACRPMFVKSLFLH